MYQVLQTTFHFNVLLLVVIVSATYFQEELFDNNPELIFHAQNLKEFGLTVEELIEHDS